LPKGHPDLEIENQLLTIAEDYSKSKTTAYNDENKIFNKTSKAFLNFEEINLYYNNNYISNELIKSLLVLKTNMISFIDLRNYFKDFKKYIENFKQNDYSEANLILVANNIEKTALEIINSYNTILKRQNIYLIPTAKYN
jgi:hypothetical protein